MALEPRIMFDGAAGTAVDQHHTDTAQSADSANDHAALQPRPAVEAPRAPTPPRALLVVDSRVDPLAQLSAQAAPGVTVLTINSNEDGLAAITAALGKLGQVDSIQILSHGAAGQFTLGNITISSDNVDKLAPRLEAWQGSLRAGADIQLYGCDVGAGAVGQTLVNEIARWTGADVAASKDDTGSASAGGNWTLETRVGVIDQPIAINAAALAGFSGLLADATPTVSLSAAGSDVLLGGQFSFTASFTNPSTQVGFAPYIDIFLPATGKDGDDGATFVSATYLGQAIKTFTVTFDLNGDATHPLAKDGTGAAIVLHAADFGMRAGDQLIVLQLPNASITQGQPAVDIVVTAQLSNLADTTASDPAPDLLVKARGGFQFGNDSADDPTIDPSLIELGTHDFTVHPTVLSLTQSVPMTDGQTPTGPNYPHAIIVTASASGGQTVTNAVISQDVPGTILVTSIVPGAGGVLSAITTSTGQVLTAPADIQAAFTRGDYISNYTITFATLTGTVDSTVNFYVPEVDANGVPVIDPVSGAPVSIVVAPPSATANWTPLDPRDISSGTIATTGTGGNAAFTVLPIAIYKDVAVTTDVGNPGATPGDTLTYTLSLQLSDYFAFGENLLQEGQFSGIDELTDGQTLVPGSGVFSYVVGGVTKTIPMVFTVTPHPNGTTTLTLDIAQSLRDAGEVSGALAGDLAFDPTLQGATIATITYQTTIGQDITTPLPDPINEGDDVGNNATFTATILEDTVNLTGGTAIDSDSTATAITPSNVDIAIVDVNGAAPTGTVELHPGDIVTFQMSYDLVTGDYQQFVLTGYLPLPLFDLSTITWAQGTGVGTWALGPGDTSPDTISSVTNGAGNSIVFDFGDNDNPGVDGSRIEVRFTLRVSDIPFGDQRSVTAQAQSDQLTTVTLEHIVSQDAVVIQSVAEPVLSITHGVVATSHGSIIGTQGTWAAPGSAGVPFTGTVTDPTAVNGDVQGIDAGDTLRLATAIENTGGGGAFDVSTSVTLPTGLTFVGGALTDTIKVYRGNGTELVLGTDYSVTGNVVTFLDPVGFPSLLPGRAGTTGDTSGANMIIITYDVVVDAAIESSRTLSSTATLTNYAGAAGGGDFTPADLTDIAGEQVAVPVITKLFANGTLDDTDSSSASTTGADVVIGETMLYDIVVTLPEGTATNLRVDDLVPPGMKLDMSFNGIGYEIITTAAGSGALTADYNGTVTGGTPTGVGGTAGDDGVDARLAFTANSTAADNDIGNNSFVIRVRLIASNVAGNQAGTALGNDTQLAYTDPDSDTANGATPIERVVARSGVLPSVTVREPTLTLTRSNNTVPELGVDRDDPVEYTFVITNGTAASDFNAYDVTFTNALPALQLTNFEILSVTYAGGTTGNSTTDFVIDPDGTLHTATGAKIDIPKGGSITLVVRGFVTDAAGNTPEIVNTAKVAWTSLDGASVDERTGADGLLQSGALNDYQQESTGTIRILHGVQLSRIGGMPDTVPPTQDRTLAQHEPVAVGEIVRYRAQTAVAEGTSDDFTLSVTLGDGLQFIDDGTIRIAFVSNGGIVSSFSNLVTGGQLQVVGDETSDLRGPIPEDLSGALPEGIFNRDLLEITTNAQGNVVLVFHLGTLTVAESDPTLEYVTIEFNTRVLNVAPNVAGTQLFAVAQTAVAGTQLATGQPIYEDIVEPGFNSVVKQVDSFTPNATATTSQANVSVRFTQNGTAPAYDVQLVDGFAGATGFTPVSVSIDGTVYTLGTLPSGVTFNAGAGGITVNFAKLDPGAVVIVNYTVDVPVDAAFANTDATLVWSSLPETFTTWGGSSVGTDGTTDGERTGNGTAPNTYVLTEGAGLGLITGTLWDDSNSADASTTPDGPPVAGQTVTLTWGGVDGNLATTADNATFTTVTNASGVFNFSALAAGQYRIDAPTPVTLAQPIGELRVRIDTDTATPLGQMVSTVGEGATAVANVGYVQQNDAPVNTLPATQNGLEDVLLQIAPITIADPDSGTGLLDVTLTVTKGVLDLSQATPGVTSTGTGTASMTLSGTLADLNAALSHINYLGALNFNGNDTLTVLTKDRGNFGDVDGDGIPAEPVEDQLQDSDVLQIVLLPVNDPPQSVVDAVNATEAGGPNNGTPGVNPTGNMLANDIDVDIATNADTLHLVSIRSVGTGNTATPPPVDPVDVVGLYGTLSFNIAGGYKYTVDNANPLVQALRATGQTLTETFEYVVTDQAGAPDTSPSVPTLTFTILPANDTPVGVNDEGAAVEAGGVANGTPGSVATGNVLTNDTDVDTVANGETKTVTGIRDVPEDDRGQVTPVAAGSPTTIAGLYGSLQISANGDYTYTPDDANPLVQGLKAGETLEETFSYTVTDTGGLSDLANLHIVITGSNDVPVAVDDAATAVEAGGTLNATPGTDPTGSVLTNDTDSDTGDTKTVTEFRTGNEAGTGTTGVFGTELRGTYGWLTLNADGTYSYRVDNAQAEVQALRTTANTLVDNFSYTVSDAAATTDRATLAVTVQGANDTPIATNDTGLAVEAGGVLNGTPGSTGSGNVLTNDSDVDTPANGEVDVVSAIRVGTEAAGGALTTVAATGTTSIAGIYGTLVIGADGAWTYTLDDANPAVQGLQAGQTLDEFFTYQVSDVGLLSDLAELHITIDGRNDNPVAVDDAATAVEAGGIANGTAGTDPAGDVLANDTDVDTGETKTVTDFRTGTEAGTGTDGVFGTELRGAYGWLTLNADGTYSYRLDNDQAEVQALRQSTDTLVDNFSYTVVDSQATTDRATLAITIQGANDTPVAVDDVATAIEAGGIANGTAGTDPSGNVITPNDTDVDQFGETLSIASFTQGANTGTPGTAFTSTYGTLLLNADGSYTYTLDNNNAAVQALRQPSDTLTEVFTYTLSDALGATTTATLTITIQGANDVPVATDDAATAVEAGGLANGTPGTDPTGNVLTNDVDVDSAANGEAFPVTAVRTGTEAGTGTAGTLGTALLGAYGSLTLNADGSYTYVVDNTLAAVQALRLPTDTLVDSFTYTVTDADGATDLATLTVTIQGANDTPVAVDDVANAIEAGGVNNGNPGIGADGNVITPNDTDVDANGEVLSIASYVQGATAGTVGAAFTATYGTFTLNADGSYVYALDNNNPDVQGLRTVADTLTEVFTYTLTDALGATSTATLTITIRGANDTPVAVDDVADAIEAGGIANGTVGTDPTGDVRANDSDVDSPANGETFPVTGVRTGTEAAGTGTAGVLGTELRGAYGWLTLNADGTYSYRLDNDQAEVQALRQPTDTLVDNFSYTITDTAGAADSATLAITIHGANDTPVAVNDVATAIEAGGIANGTPGTNPSGNVITENDSDVDGPAYGEVLTIASYTQGATPGTVGTAFAATYGSLLLNADGSYTYTLDNNNADVQGLRTPADTLTEVFTYTLTDAAGATTTATLTITIQGTNDVPAATDDAATAVEAGGIANGTPGTDPAGNVLDNDVDVDSPANGEAFPVTAVRTGAEAGTGTAGTLGTALPGAYGSLTLNADGSYTYVVDNTLPAVQALRQSTDTLVDSFTYTVTDADGTTDLATLTITIQGANDTPVAVNDTALAIEAGGIANGTPGTNPSGNVITENDSDVDGAAYGEVLTIASYVQGATPGTVGTAFASTYGSLLLAADGSYTYTLDNNNVDVQALRTPLDTLTEVFTYTLTDAAGATTTATLTITIRGTDDTPTAVDDVATAIEAGGILNGTPGTDPTGNVLTNDSDVDAPANGEAFPVSSVRTGTEAGTGTDGVLGTELRGAYGWLTLNTDGTYSYRLDNDQAEVQALRQPTDTLTDSFSYTTTDTAGASDRATLTITIQGANDTPVAVNDVATAIEAGGIANGTAGTDPSGNVITENDSDVDANGEAISLTGYTLGATAGTLGAPLTTAYGSFTLGADGAYTYTLDNNNAAVQALRTPTDALTEVFTYTLTDALGATTTATLTITIQGTDDTPVATDDAATAVEASGVLNGTAGTDPAGNVLTNDTDVDGGTASPIDYGETQAVSSVRTGTEAGTGTDGTLATELRGAYGWLTLNADGSYTYRLDNDQAEVQALRLATDTLVDNFSYTVIDTTGQTDRATLAITIQGANDTPVAVNDVATAIEAGGIANGTPGTDPSGNVITENDSDVDAFGEAITIAGYTYNAGAGTVGTAFTTTYGSLLLNADGSYTYTLDNNNVDVQALRQPSDTLTEVFTYTLQDALGATTTATLTITIQGADDTPVAVDDAATAIEAGGIANGTAGTDPTGNVLTNDSDVDAPANGEAFPVSTVRTGTEAGTGTDGVLGTELRGAYGWLTLNTDGTYSYRLDNAQAEVQALRLATDTLTDSFSYTTTDTAGASDRATLTITIQGANDTPVAVNDTALSIEAGGIANGTPGTNPSGNVITENDSDVDGPAYGEVLTIASYVQGATPGTVGTAFTTTYGSLLLNADGSYTYTLDNNNVDVQALRTPLDTLTEVFTYTLQDALGATTTATLTITIRGTDDTPVALDDAATAIEAGGILNGTAGTDPTGNVLTNDSDVDAPANGEAFPVSTVRTGTEAGTGTNGILGTELRGAYGWLTLNADGIYSYRLDNNQAEVQALRQPTDTLVDSFSYTTTDAAGASDRATLTITIQGANDTPVAVNDTALSIEAGGIANGTPGTNPSGNVITENDRDVDGPAYGEAISLTGYTLGATNGTLGTPLTTAYGSFTLGADGAYSYTLDNNNAQVQALRTPADTLTEAFTYTLTDALGASTTATLTVTIRGTDDTPVAADDAATALEAGGVDNGTPGIDPTGNVLTNDTDVDGGAASPIDYGETKSVSSVRTGIEFGTGTDGILASELHGAYGWLTLNADGSYSYRLDNNQAEVQALRTNGQTLHDRFSYTVADTAGQQDRATLTITIQGVDDTPGAVDDTARAVEAGGIGNAVTGTDPTGNVLLNDGDVDSGDNGETLSVSGFRQGLSFGTLGTPFAGAYGSLILNADGSYSYTVDNANPAVEALRIEFDTLSDVFTYTLIDAEGATSTATLTVTIHGRNDDPIAIDDPLIAQEAGGVLNQTPGINPTGNLLGNDTDVDANDTKTVDGIRGGTEAEGGLFRPVNGSQVVVGQWGTLTVNADGTYSYVVDNDAFLVQRMRAGDTLTESFTYRMHDTQGASDIAQITVVVQGAWDAPVATDDSDLAVPALAGSRGINPTGNVLNNDADVDRTDVDTGTGIRTGAEIEPGGGIPRPFTAIRAGSDRTNGALLIGLYGELVIGANGDYIYRVNSFSPEVLALLPGEFVVDTFTYRVTDLGGLDDLAQLSIIVRGRNNLPQGLDDTAVAVEAGGLANAVPGLDPSGNVLGNDVEFDRDPMHVADFRTGTENGFGNAGEVGGAALRGLWGELTLAADGSWRYTVDNTLPEVQALRVSGQTLEDVFSYTVHDQFDVGTVAELRITVDGRNDTPVASDDAIIAVEAGGTFNATPGVNPTGNVLDNDSDVDSVANGETKAVEHYANSAGVQSLAGLPLAGLYGSLVLNADGSYTYTVDNDNPAVQALRPYRTGLVYPLTEVFNYTMRDAEGAESQARLVITVNPANDNPVARDDSNFASDQTPEPQAVGNVLPNDSDVDLADTLHVVGIRAGAETETGPVHTIDQPIKGRYGTLVIDLFGNYTYTIDQSNPEVQAQAGAGRVLTDVFTYTVADSSGGTDQAELRIDLEISPQFIDVEDPGPHFRHFERRDDGLLTTEVDPAVFIAPVVETNSLISRLSRLATDGTDAALVFDRGIQSESIGAGLGEVGEQYIHQAVRASAIASQIDLARLVGRHGRVSLTADGLLGGPSVFTGSDGDLTVGPAQRASNENNGDQPNGNNILGDGQTATAFTEQLRLASRQFSPSWFQ
ncbi:VCBS domain-containing protein [Variovorax rhizosphaerae]|uniref:VCBS domain-containing protein n=1 Tax=Variovorax rhizosphaerae TaxID=1836200 RepID=A0ABU8WFQ6_9BURK